MKRNNIFQKMLYFAEDPCMTPFSCFEQASEKGTSGFKLQAHLWMANNLHYYYSDTRTHILKILTSQMILIQVRYFKLIMKPCYLHIIFRNTFAFHYLSYVKLYRAIDFINYNNTILLFFKSAPWATPLSKQCLILIQLIYCYRVYFRQIIFLENINRNDMYEKYNLSLICTQILTFDLISN